MNSPESSRTGWGSSYRLIAADKWKAKSAAMGRAVTQGLVEYAAPCAGMTVLDLASGTGEPAITIAGLVRPTGHVTALDQSAQLLEIAAGRARSRSLSNISFQQADAHSLPFPDEQFDLATCRFGVMFFHDVERALRELCRVLKPGARACFAAWGPLEQPYWQSTMGVVARRVGGPVIPEGGEDPFRFASPQSLSAELRKAGFAGVEESTRHFDWSWPGTADELWEYAQAVAAPLRGLLEKVSEAQWPAINAEVTAALNQRSDPQGVHFQAEIVLASGRKAP
jgi:ubiquinone/menaquinone biosynthesis C-methylase UbiE